MRLALLLVALAASVPVARGQRSAQGTRVQDTELAARLIATGGIGGHLARPVCSDGTLFQPTALAHLSTALRAGALGDDHALLLDTGGLLTPGGVARFAVSETPDALTSAVVRMGYRALAFGPDELGAPRAPLLRVLSALRRRGVPAIASNLYCEHAARSLCAVLVDGGDGPSLHSAGTRRVAVLAFLPSTTLDRLAPASRRGVHIRPISEALGPAVRQARRRGANLIVAIVHHGHARDAAARTLALASGLADEDRPDLILSSDGGGEILFARPQGMLPAVVAPPRGGAVAVRIRRSPWTDAYDVLALPVQAQDEVEPAFDRFLAELGRAYCAVWGHALPGARLSQPFLEADFRLLAAGVMRDLSGAEIALLAHATVDPQFDAAAGDTLTASDVYMAYTADESLVTARVPASWLQAVAGQLTGEAWFALGLERDGSRVKVNGRAIEPRASYRVVALRSLAAGGLPSGVEWEAVEGPALRAAVLAYLTRPRDADPRDALPDPADRLAWTFGIDGEATFAGSAMRNPTDRAGTPIYTASQLGRANAVTFGFQTTLRANASSTDWGWENEAVARFRLTRVGADDFAEGDDLLSYRTTALYQGLRSRSKHFYVPDAYFEGYLESEFTLPDEGRSYHHMLVRPTLGARFTLTRHLRLKAGAGFSQEVLDPTATFEPGLSLQLVLTTWEIMRQEDRRLALSWSIDYFVSAQSQELRGDLEAVLDLAGPLALVFGFKLFTQRDPGQTVGLATDATAALRVRWLTRTPP